MLRKVFDGFTATHATILALGAMFVPGALYAVPSFTNVAIEDPVTGARAVVDNGRRVYVYDPIAGYRNLPSNSVNIVVPNRGTECESGFSYSIPSGKALVIVAVSGDASKTNAGGTNAGWSITNAADCSGNLLTSWQTSDQFAPVAVDMGSGIVVRGTQTISMRSYNNTGTTYIHGYLIPAGAAGSNAEIYEGRPVTAAMYAHR